MTIGSHRCLSRSTTRPIVQGASMYSGENKPVTLTPNQENASHMMTRAVIKVGVATPI